MLGCEEKEHLWTSIDTEINIDLKETLHNNPKKCKICVHDTNKMYNDEEDSRYEELLNSESATTLMPSWSAFYSRVVGEDPYETHLIIGLSAQHSVLSC